MENFWSDEGQCNFKHINVLWLGIYFGPQWDNSNFSLVQEAHIVGITLVGGVAIYPLSNQKQ